MPKPSETKIDRKVGCAQFLLRGIFQELKNLDADERTAIALKFIAPMKYGNAKI